MLHATASNMSEVQKPFYYLPDITFQNLRNDFTRDASPFYIDGDVNSFQIRECCSRHNFPEDDIPTNQAFQNFLRNRHARTSRRLLSVLCLCLYDIPFEKWYRELDAAERPSSTRPVQPQQATEAQETQISPDGLERVILDPSPRQLLQEALDSAEREVWIFGTSLEVSLSVIPNEHYLAVLKRGIVLRFLAFDHTGPTRLQYLAEASGVSLRVANSSCDMTIVDLVELMKLWHSVGQGEFDPSLLQVKLTQNPLRMRATVVDPDNIEAKSYFIPSVNQSKTAHLPAFLCRNTPGGLIHTYSNKLAAEWNRSAWMQEFLQTDAGAEYLGDPPIISESYPIELMESRPIQ